MKLRVAVEDYHFRHARPGIPSQSPIALALGPRLPAGHVEIAGGRADFFEIADGFIMVPYSKTRAWPVRVMRPATFLRSWRLPAEAVAAQGAFDTKGIAEPFVFELDLSAAETETC